jgi:hypothetical protein
MVALTKFLDFAEQWGKGVHDFSTDEIKVAYTNSAPVNTNTILANITQIGTQGGYTTGAGGGYVVANTVWTETGGVGKLDADDLVVTATGAAILQFRYIVLYNNTPTSIVDPLIGWYDYGSALDIADTETLTHTWDAAGILTLI